MIPGANLLNMAFSVIAKQTVVYFAYLGRALNNVGQDVSTYSPGVLMQGSFQPVPRKLYTQYGLDLQRDYFTFYTSNNILDLERGVSGDQIVFNNTRFQCESDNDWFHIDGWKGVLCVSIKAGDEQPIFGFNGEVLHNSNQNFGRGNFIGGS